MACFSRKEGFHLSQGSLLQVLLNRIQNLLFFSNSNINITKYILIPENILQSLNFFFFFQHQPRTTKNLLRPGMLNDSLPHLKKLKSRSLARSFISRKRNLQRMVIRAVPRKNFIVDPLIQARKVAKGTI